MANHDGIRELGEDEAAQLFETGEVQTTADAVASFFRDADLESGKAGDLKRRAQQKWLESQAITQADGGRLAKVEGNELMAQAMAASAASETRTVAGEKAWAVLAAKFGAYVPHGRRLELRAKERPGWVYCFDVDDGEMAMHQADACPNGSLRHDRNATMLRRRGPGGRLGLWPGRREG